jgi:hypothetical protein
MGLFPPIGELFVFFLMSRPAPRDPNGCVTVRQFFADVTSKFRLRSRLASGIRSLVPGICGGNAERMHCVGDPPISP